MDLGLHDPERAAEFLSGSLRLVGGEDGDAAGDGQAELLQDSFALIFMDVHSFLSAAAVEGAKAGASPAWRLWMLVRRERG
jgi:hypothetical protein